MDSINMGLLLYCFVPIAIFFGSKITCRIPMKKSVGKIKVSYD